MGVVGLVCWKKGTLRVAGFFLSERYGQLLAGFGKGGKLKCFIKPEERTTTLKPETGKVLMNNFCIKFDFHFHCLA